MSGLRTLIYVVPRFGLIHCFWLSWACFYLTWSTPVSQNWTPIWFSEQLFFRNFSPDFQGYGGTMYTTMHCCSFATVVWALRLNPLRLKNWGESSFVSLLVNRSMVYKLGSCSWQRKLKAVGVGRGQRMLKCREKTLMKFEVLVPTFFEASCISALGPLNKLPVF